MRLLLATPFALAVASPVAAQVVDFAAVPALPQGSAALYSWAQFDKEFMLQSTGALRMRSSPRITLSLPKPNSWEIESLATAGVDGDLMLAYQASSGGDIVGSVCRVRADLKAIRWCRAVNTFNLAAALGHETILVGGMGFVGRMDPVNGKLLWKHDWLYGSFSGASQDSFTVVCPESDEHWHGYVTFISKGSGTGSGKRIRLRRDGGAVVSVEDAPSFRSCRELGSAPP